MPTVRTSRRGVALPITIFVVTLITLLLSTGFARIKAEGEITTNSNEVTVALAVAQSGLETYLSLLNVDACERPLRPANGDSVRVNVTGGYAWVVARVVQRPLDTLANWLYIVKSTGYAVKPAIGPAPRAQRTVAQFARWQPGAINATGAWTAANGITGAIDGGADGEFRGGDMASSSCDQPALPGLHVPSGQSPGDLSNYTVTGSPTVLQSGTPWAVATGTYINWAEVTSIRPDYTSFQSWNWDYTVQLVTGNLTIGNVGSDHVGTGLLIVTGDLRLRGNFFQFYGVILVGGRLIMDANDQRFDGWVASGLNEGLGAPVSASVLGATNNYTDFDYNSTYVWMGMRNLAGWVAVENAWTDNWALY